MNALDYFYYCFFPKDEIFKIKEEISLYKERCQSFSDRYGKDCRSCIYYRDRINQLEKELAKLL